MPVKEAKCAFKLPSFPPSLQPLLMLPTWQKAFESLDSMGPSAPPVVLVKGQTKTGKSTCSRTLVNSLLSRYQRVAFLECDVGQTEFTPPGIVSLTIIDTPILGQFITTTFLDWLLTNIDRSSFHAPSPAICIALHRLNNTSQ